jgi:predicted transcriptional regulator
MEIHLAPATEAQLQHLATSQGKNAAQVVEETMTRVLEQQAEFLAGIERGIDDSKRGNMVSHEEVVARIHRIFNKS